MANEGLCQEHRALLCTVIQPPVLQPKGLKAGSNPFVAMVNMDRELQENAPQ